MWGCIRLGLRLILPAILATATRDWPSRRQGYATAYSFSPEIVDAVKEIMGVN